MSRLAIGLGACLWLTHAAAMAVDHTALEAYLRSQVKSAPARRVAIYLEDRRGRKIIAINPDQVFPSASLMKIPIAAVCLQKWERQPALRTAKRRQMLFRMLNESNNRDADALVVHAGGRRVINLFCDQMGWPRSELHHRFQAGGDRRYSNSTTAAEMAGMLRQIDDRKLISRAASQRMYDCLQKGKYVTRIPAGIPRGDGVVVANKTGTMRAVLHDSAIVRGNGRHYLLVILTHRYTSEKAGTAFCKRISAKVYESLKPR